MIYSMTAFARKQLKGDWGTAVWEIRSVNQRYLETYLVYLSNLEVWKVS